MLDALFPAAPAARAALDGGGDLAAVTAAARDAAAAGAAATIPMLATKGRASYLGERSIGHQDPGATSSALLLARPRRDGGRGHLGPGSGDGLTSRWRGPRSSGGRVAGRRDRACAVGRRGRPGSATACRRGRERDAADGAATAASRAGRCRGRARPRSPPRRPDGRARTSARSSRPRRCSRATRGSSTRRWRRSTTGATAEEAIDRVTAAQADALAAVDDEYFRERAADLRDVGRRVVDRLTGRERPPLHRADGSPAVLVADDLDPSVVVAIRPELVTGIALAGGAPTGHAAIVARALGIPLVLGLGAAVDGATRRRRGGRRRLRPAGCSSSRTRTISRR